MYRGSLRECKQRDLVKTIESILESAKRGEIKGLLYAVHMADGGQYVGAVGDYIEDPEPGLNKIYECLVEVEIKKVAE